jgi:hypothetical protein
MKKFPDYAFYARKFRRGGFFEEAARFDSYAEYITSNGIHWPLYNEDLPRDRSLAKVEDIME